MGTAVLLDLDGTVWDSEPWFRQLLGGDHDASLQPAAKALKARGYSEAKVRRACTETPPPLFSGMETVLGELATNGLRIGAVTNLPKWLYRPMLSAFDLPFETVIGWSDAPRRKPHPDPLEVALSKLELQGAPEHWYVGDREEDSLAAAAAGMSFAWASWGYENNPPADTTIVLDTPEEIRDLV